MNEQDEIDIQLLPDGSFKIITDPISSANHVSADQLIKMIGRMSGGEMKATPRHTKKHKHQHQTKAKVQQR